jgi:hypothetical protein
MTSPLEPQCSIRRCRHFIGIEDSLDPPKARFVCTAFPEEGIPMEIAYGGNPHLEPYPGDHGIRYEREP